MLVPLFQVAEYTPNLPAEAEPACTTPMSPGVNVFPGSEDDGWTMPDPVPLADGSTVQLFKDGHALKAAYDKIAAAKSRVCLEVYIFASDQTGRAFADLLIAKARRGVRIYLLYDSFGCLDSDGEMFDRMARAGVIMQEFNPVFPWRCRYSWRPMNRDHRKLLIVDDSIGWMGGMNIADQYAGSWVVPDACRMEDCWRDTAIGIIGPSVRPLLRSFIQSWQYVMHGGPIARAGYSHALIPARDLRRRTSQRLRHRRRPAVKQRVVAPQPDVLTGDIGLLASVSTTASPLRPLLHRLFREATRSIQLTMAYFAPDDELIAELCQAAQRGVRVQLVIPGRSDVPIITVVARSFYDILMTAGVEIYERQSIVLHAKTMVIDGHLSVVGSANLDYHSIEYNCELTMLIRSPDFGKHMQVLFANDICYSKRIHHYEWRKRPILDRFGQWIVSRARYLL